MATNTKFSLTNNPFQSDSLARSASGTLYSADPVGMIWDVTNAFQIPVGPTSRTMIGDLVMGVNGLWGFSNASQELFFFDFGTSAVTYAQTISRPSEEIVARKSHTGGSLCVSAVMEPSRGSSSTISLPPRAKDRPANGTSASIAELMSGR